MKRVTTVGISILMIAISGLFFSSYAADTKKATTKSLTVKTVTPPKTSTKGKKLPTTGVKPKRLILKPNLVVEEISLKGGFIAFRLKNRGPGSLSDDDHKQGKVKQRSRIKAGFPKKPILFQRLIQRESLRSQEGVYHTQPGKC